MRGVTTTKSLKNFIEGKFQLTRLMRGVTMHCESWQAVLIAISTHTPHARRDCGHSGFFIFYINFNSHASCEA